MSACRSGTWHADRLAPACSPQHLRSYARLSHLALDPGTLLRPLPLGGVNWLDLERVEDRYLLAASSDASVVLYDTQGQEEEAAGQVPPGQGPALPGLAPLLSLTKASPGGHRFSVSSAAWYPLDNGLFVTGGYDCQVKVWDANTPALADSFSLDSRVHCLALSAVPGAHCLTAAGCEDPAIQLCDLASGARLHSLAGHRAPVLALAWSPAAAWQLLSGAADGSLRVWDVRRSGASLAVLDLESTGPGGALPAAAARSAAPDPAAAPAGAGARPGRAFPPLRLGGAGLRPAQRRRAVHAARRAPRGRARLRLERGGRRHAIHGRGGPAGADLAPESWAR
ncbi:hypothetical protein ACKKBG_A08775 [Auxenochlorella protothecoides x Auxenochlorella symbiontica]